MPNTRLKFQTMLDVFTASPRFEHNERSKGVRGFDYQRVLVEYNTFSIIFGLSVFWY